MRKTIYETNYDRLEELGILTIKTHKKIENKSYMPLSIEWISHNIISLCHYGEQNGDLMRDPEKTLFTRSNYDNN